MLYTEWSQAEASWLISLKFELSCSPMMDIDQYNKFERRIYHLWHSVMLDCVPSLLLIWFIKYTKLILKCSSKGRYQFNVAHYSEDPS